MSPPTKSVLLPKVFPLSLVNLGQLLPNPLNPSFSSCIPERPITEDDYSKLEESEYTATLTLEKSGKLKASFTKLFGAFFGVRTVNTIGLYARTAFHLELIQPDAIFRKVVQESEVQAWLNEMAQYHKPVYFVVGLQVIIDGVFKQRIDRSEEAGISMHVPLEAVGLPAHGSAQATGLVKGEGYVEGKVLGENVLGILVRKVNYKIRNSGDRPTLVEESVWKYPYERVKGDREEEALVLEVSIGDHVGDDDLGGMSDGLGEEDDEDDEDED
ncbi:unnamed protein product [Tuber melanosporum]|uniref:(Perigord truffle) hypothetical protein n=1 Tax=Tuber melanosporum (strain Mel28) TaxID=656061 RepID=D5G8Z8_TUBMM|nr:uncharacterized protein GSTUM_00004912001 [Tuber melanosporum]CAZ80991.1 unnamed protein product [Tuber melanosporum]